MLCRLFSAVVFFSALLIARAATPNPEAPIRLILGLGDVHHPVSTKNKEAQQFFDQGMNLVYGFNHDEARRSFMRAAELDPKLAMAHWGVALTLGPNYNLPVDPERERAGSDVCQRVIRCCRQINNVRTSCSVSILTVLHLEVQALPALPPVHGWKFSRSSGRRGKVCFKRCARRETDARFRGISPVNDVRVVPL